MRSPGHIGLPPGLPPSQLGTHRGFRNTDFRNNGFRNNSFRNNAFGWGGAGWGHPSYYDGYADSNYDGNGYQSLIIPEPEQESWAPIVVQPPPPPVRPEIHEYKWPESASNAVFSIVAKDGSVQSAVAVWVQGNSVRYIGPEGTAGHLPLDSVNRQATRRANSEKNPRWHCPPARARAADCVMVSHESPRAGAWGSRCQHLPAAAAAFLVGAITSVAGGGTLISFPTLLWVADCSGRSIGRSGLGGVQP